jgi:integrase
MINRENYHDVKKFITFQREIKQNTEGSLESEYYRLLYLMKWADEKAFPEAKTIKPTFPAILEKKINAQGLPYTPETLQGICKICRAFFEWCKNTYPGRYRGIDANWIQSLRPSRARSMQSELRTRRIYTIEDIRKLVGCPCESIPEKRMRAAVAFLFISGMRISAFLSLPLDCVDMEKLRVMQLPIKGVKTKNSKAAITYMLRIPDLVQVAAEWDAFLRARLPENAYWFAFLDKGQELTINFEGRKNAVGTRQEFNKFLCAFCERAGVEYLSAHKLRHGHAVYALKAAKKTSDLKAISMNLMHSNIGITDGIYGRLVEDDIQTAISGLTEDGGEIGTTEMERKMEEMIRRVMKEKQ